MSDQQMRTERDSMGEIEVPAAAKWQAQTQRAIDNFPISGRPIEPALIHALAAIKAASARARAESGALESDVAQAISQAAQEVAEGRWDAEFPIDVFQTGSGTSSNMNANEVIATLATEKLGRAVHPNDGVNDPFSSNDQFPSAIHIAAAAGVKDDLLPALEVLSKSLRRKETEFADAVKSGRTHLMDATPVTLGQEFGGYAAQVEFVAARLRDGLPHVGELPLGGSAVGTGINVPEGMAATVIADLAQQLDLPLTEATNHFAAQSSRDALAELSGTLRTVAIAFTKIANDIRWMGSGPTAGLAEIHLPDLQPGSSIMPGKVNPVLCEAMLQVSAQVIGNDAAVAFGASAGTFELNVMLPVIARNLLESVQLLANVSRVFALRCLDGIEADRDRMRRYAESSPSIVTALNHQLGYDEAASIAKQALKEGKTIREVVLERGHVADGKLTEEQLDEALDVLAMTRG
ncbi:aspartate ammonia-lyase [Yimella sp. cx-51]|uniref:class II fumarate hydratase n=1 Tax=Yimella sp. cx-51 TaxID=2770551 RepID=UPI00165DB46E|nr:class II fumarate hydratase [Yimella sp. cx-51]MBC9956549.1 class II fumarate hydratase [Yimella sp. cx-51]QTH38347.1 class II fumarate hydratase [Yimella sp. cx-51]